VDTQKLWDPAELGDRMEREKFDVLVVEADFVFEELFEAAPNLRLVGICRNALNHVDLDAATVRGVPVVHARGRNTNAVAEMTIALMMALGRRIVPASMLVSGGGWRDPAAGYRTFRGRELAGSTVGVIGFGAIGREVARKCLALGARVLAHDPYVAERDIRPLATPATLAEVAAADFVTLHLPDSPETHGFADEAFFAGMRRDAYLINTGAGASVESSALAEALATGAIAGSALDVFEGQPLPASSPLLSAPNLLLTPHIAGATHETVERHSRIITGEIERFVAGETLHYVVNPDHALARV
jgi:phosphoglycerate dehydrogenase-like enzyme